MIQDPPAFSFLKDGGEMGKLTRNFDWSVTDIGAPHTWPLSLRTTVGLLLHSSFPMVLFWGKETMITFYNDAFLPSLGSNGKHPGLGKPAKEVWNDIWDFIGPLLHQVMEAGEAIYFEDQLVPFYRNGSTEEIYWTVSYSPAYDDNGMINGVFVTCTETTKTIINLSEAKKSEERFQNLVRDTTAAIVVLTGEEMKVEIVNEAYGRLISLKPEELLNKPLFDVIPDAKAYYLPLLEKVRKTGEPVYLYDSPYTVVVNGKKIEGFLHVVYQPYRDAQGTLLGVMVICQDVTEQVKARHKLEESESRLELLSNTVPAMIFYLDAEQHYRSYNETFMQWFGVDAKEAIGKTVREFLGEEAYQLISPHLLKAYAGEQEQYEINAPLRLVGRKWLRIVYTPHKADDGTVLGLIAHATDITQSKLSAIALEESEGDLRNLVLTSPTGICVVDAATLIIEIVNDAFVTIAGKPYEAIMGKHYWDAFAEAASYYEAALQSVIDEGQPFYANEVELMLVRNGKAETIYVTFVFEPMKDANGKVKKVVVWVAENTLQVTERKHIEELVAQRTKDLAEANLLLKQNNHELEQFAYIASHDLQEPLRKVSTFAQMLKKQLGEVDEKSQGYLDKINASTLRMMQLIHDVLDFSLLSNQQYIFERVDIKALIKQLETDFELVIQQKNAVLQYEGLPILNANPLQMRQLFGNLLSNALKFTQEDVAPVISITSNQLSAVEKATFKDLLPEVDYCIIKVIDNGIGFSEEYAEKIFMIFQRLHGRSEFAGTGIGLALCKKIAQNHHGEIWATSQKDEGTVFHIILPCPQNADEHI